MNIFIVVGTCLAMIFLISYLFQKELFCKKQAKNSLSIDDYIMKIKLADKSQMKFSRIESSNLNLRICDIMQNNKEAMFCEKPIFDSINFLLDLSKFLDEKFKNLRQEFRGIKEGTFVELVTKDVSQKFYQNYKYDIFKSINQINERFQFQKKEINVLSLILLKSLLENVINIEQKLILIRNSIIYAKNAKIVYLHKNTMLHTAKIYSICKFNKKLRQSLHYKKFINSSKNQVREFIFSLYYNEKFFQKSISLLKRLLK